MEINIDDETLFGFAWAFIIVAVVIIIAGAIVSGRRSSQNAACPVQRMHAVLVDKPAVPANTLYAKVWLTFQTDDGQRVRLLVSYRNDMPLQGDRGMLAWQGDALISFVRDGIPRTGGQTQSSAVDPNRLPTWKRIEMERQASQEKKE